jgi:hypothetical protein
MSSLRRQELIATSRCYPARPFAGEKCVMDKDDAIATLDDLIETSRDGEGAFALAQAVERIQLKQNFRGGRRPMQAGR